MSKQLFSDTLTEEQLNNPIKLRLLRNCRFCVTGTRAYFTRVMEPHGFTFKDLRQGKISVRDIADIEDAMVRKLVKEALKEQ